MSAPASAASISWTPHAAAQQNAWRSVTWSPQLGLFVAVSDTGTNRVMTSPDGINWTARTAASQIAWHSVTWSSDLGLFVAVAADASVNSVMTSPDGITWTARTIPSGIWRGVTWSDDLNLFVAVSSFGTNSVATSPDGITWTARAVPDDLNWWSLVWSPERAIFVATSVNGSTNRVMTSPDGITWTVSDAAEANNWFPIVWSPELGVFVSTAISGTNRVMVGRLFDITTTTVAAGNVGTAYSQPVAATGGTGPYTWSIATGTLPPGLTLDASTGVISGTPTIPGTYNFTIQAEDAGTGIETQDLTITVASVPPTVPDSSNPSTPGEGGLAETGMNQTSIVSIAALLLITGVGSLLFKNQLVREMLK